MGSSLLCNRYVLAVCTRRIIRISICYLEIDIKVENSKLQKVAKFKKLPMCNNKQYSLLNVKSKHITHCSIKFLLFSLLLALEWILLLNHVEIAKEHMNRKVFNEGGNRLKGNAGRNCEWDYGNLIEHPRNEKMFAINLRSF